MGNLIIATYKVKHTYLEFKIQIMTGTHLIANKIKRAIERIYNLSATSYIKSKDHEDLNLN